MSESSLTCCTQKVVYTCITGDYDDLISHSFVAEGWDYVCFTDNARLLAAGKCGCWQIKPLCFCERDNSYTNRRHKFFPHVLFPEYEASLYIDANIDILTPFLFDEISRRKQSFLLPRHFCRQCLYDEFVEVLTSGYEKQPVLQQHYDFLKQAGFPRNWGLGENNILYRRHDDSRLRAVMDDWWALLQKYSRRDQLGLAFALWKNGIDIKGCFIPNARADRDNYRFFSHKRDNVGTYARCGGKSREAGGEALAGGSGEECATGGEEVRANGGGETCVCGREDICAEEVRKSGGGKELVPQVRPKSFRIRFLRLLSSLIPFAGLRHDFRAHFLGQKKYIRPEMLFEGRRRLP